MKKILALFAVIFSIGCAGAPDIDTSAVVVPLPGADAAISIIQKRFGITSQPEVVWYGGYKLECNNGTGWKAAGAVSEENPDGCVDGVYGGGTAVVSDWGRFYPIHETALAHEFLHYKFDITGQSLDLGHNGPAWKPGGLLEQAREDLIQAGY